MTTSRKPLCESVALSQRALTLGVLSWPHGLGAPSVCFESGLGLVSGLCRQGGDPSLPGPQVNSRLAELRFN